MHGGETVPDVLRDGFFLPKIIIFPDKNNPRSLGGCFSVYRMMRVSFYELKRVNAGDTHIYRTLLCHSVTYL